MSVTSFFQELQNSAGTVLGISQTAVKVAADYRQLTGNGLSTPQTSTPAVQADPVNKDTGMDDQATVTGGGFMGWVKKNPVVAGAGALVVALLVFMGLRRRR